MVDILLAFKKQNWNRVCGCEPVILAFRRLRQEDHMFKANLGQKARASLKKQILKKSETGEDVWLAT
jgi:hypothetical protein